LEKAVAAAVAAHNMTLREKLKNVSPNDVYAGRMKEILERRAENQAAHAGETEGVQPSQAARIAKIKQWESVPKRLTCNSHSPETFHPMPGIRKVMGKEPPWPSSNA